MEAILSGKARRHLKALGHHLQPVVLVGKEGQSDSLVAAIKEALLTHELIKVKLGENVPGDRKDVAAALATASKSELIGVTGRTLLLYKRNPQKAKIELPSDKKKKAGAKDAAAPAAKAGKKSNKSAAKKSAAAPASSDDSGALDDGDDEGDDDGDFEDDDGDDESVD